MVVYFLFQEWQYCLKKAMPIALIILAFFAIQVFSYVLKNNPADILSPIGLVGLLTLLNLIDNKSKFKSLF